MLLIHNATVEGYVSSTQGPKTGTTEKGLWASVPATINGQNQKDSNDKAEMWVEIAAYNGSKAAQAIAQSQHKTRFIATGRIQPDSYNNKLKLKLFADTFVAVGTGSTDPEPQQKPKVVKAGPGVQATRPSDEEFARQLGGHYAEMLDEDSVPF